MSLSPTIRFLLKRAWESSNHQLRTSALPTMGVTIIINYTGCFIKFYIILDVNMTKTIWSRQMKLNRLNVEQYN